MTTNAGFRYTYYLSIHKNIPLLLHLHEKSQFSLTEYKSTKNIDVRISGFGYLRDHVITTRCSPGLFIR